MKVSLENMGGCRRRLKGEIPADQVRLTEEKVTLSIQKSARLLDFAPGMPPRNGPPPLRQRYSI